MTKPILKICDELLELEKKATLASAVYAGEYMHLEEPNGLRCALDMYPDDAKFYEVSRKHIRVLCETLKEAAVCIKMSNRLDNSWNAEWLKKWGGK